MRYQELLEDFNNKGTFVGAKLSSKSAQTVAAWAKKNNIPNPTQPKDMHVTILHSEKTFNWDCDQYNPALQIDPTTYHFDKFGSNNDILILAFNSRELEARHDKGMTEHDLTWDFPNYIPHLTISNDAKDVDLSKLEMPIFPLYLVGEYKKDFDPEWKDSISEAVGIIVPNVNTTVDVQPGETQRQDRKVTVIK